MSILTPIREYKRIENAGKVGFKIISQIQSPEKIKQAGQTKLIIKTIQTQ